jgi:hypothetical protein
VTWYWDTGKEGKEWFLFQVGWAEEGYHVEVSHGRVIGLEELVGWKGLNGREYILDSHWDF